MNNLVQINFCFRGITSGKINRSGIAESEHKHIGSLFDLAKFPSLRIVVISILYSYI